MPIRSQNSIAWHFWHSSRIEDIATSFFITSKEQVFTKHGFNKRLGADFTDTGNDLNRDQMAYFNSKIDVKELKKYRIAVGKATIDAVQKLEPKDLNPKNSMAYYRD